MDEVDQLLLQTDYVQGQLCLLQPWQVKRAAYQFARRMCAQAVREARMRAGKHVRYLRRKREARMRGAE